MIKGNVVDGIELVVAMNFLINECSYGLWRIIGFTLAVACWDELIQRSPDMEGDTSLPPKEPRTHIDTIIGWALLEVLNISLVLHLLCLKVVTGVILVATSDWDDTQWGESLQRMATLRSEGKHLQQSRLCLVRGVLRSPFSLSYPEAFFLGNSIVHVLGE